jgi:hypothetical protein
MGHPRSVFVLGRGAEGGELAALCIIGLSRPLSTGKIMTACSVTLSLIFCTAPIPPQRKRDPPRSFALLNYCEKRANNAAAHVQLRQIYWPFFTSPVAAIINSVISVALFAGAI